MRYGLGEATDAGHRQSLCVRCDNCESLRRDALWGKPPQPRSGLTFKCCTCRPRAGIAKTRTAWRNVRRMQSRAERRGMDRRPISAAVTASATVRTSHSDGCGAAKNRPVELACSVWDPPGEDKSPAALAHRTGRSTRSSATCAITPRAGRVRAARRGAIAASFSRSCGGPAREGVTRYRRASARPNRHDPSRIFTLPLSAVCRVIVVVTVVSISSTALTARYGAPGPLHLGSRARFDRVADLVRPQKQLRRSRNRLVSPRRMSISV
jgi:hypothetical protein